MYQLLKPFEATKMASWYIMIFSLCVLPFIIKILLAPLLPAKTRASLPPAPPTFPIIGNFLWLQKTFSEIESNLRDLHAKLGPIVTLHIGSYPAIFIGDGTLAHEALVKNGAVFADRPPAGEFNLNNHNINAAPYGATWRVLRKNLASQILNPLQVKNFSRARKLVITSLIKKLDSKCLRGETVPVMEHMRFAVLSLLALLCFGDKLDDGEIKKIEEAHMQVLMNFQKAKILNFWPRVTKILFYNNWKEFQEVRRNQEETMISIIRAHQKSKTESTDGTQVSYVDTLLELEHPEEKRKLNNVELFSLCSEFLAAGTDSTATTLQWIMAYLVKYPHIQEKIFGEIQLVVRDEEEVKEEDLCKMPYLKAVVLEGLRRHPPTPLLMPHRVTRDVVLNGYLVPKEGTVNFMVGKMGLDPNVWEDPTEFKPERFLGEEGFDVTGSREVKMIPFGAGRRLCPGYGMALLHLEYFVANLVWYFEWRPVEGDDVDLSEKQEFTIVMKHPLQANLRPRRPS